MPDALPDKEHKNCPELPPPDDRHAQTIVFEPPKCRESMLSNVQQGVAARAMGSKCQEIGPAIHLLARTPDILVRSAAIDFPAVPPLGSGPNKFDRSVVRSHQSGGPSASHTDFVSSIWRELALPRQVLRPLPDTERPPAAPHRRGFDAPRPLAALIRLPVALALVVGRHGKVLKQFSGDGAEIEGGDPRSL